MIQKFITMTSAKEWCLGQTFFAVWVITEGSACHSAAEMMYCTLIGWNCPAMVKQSISRIMSVKVLEVLVDGYWYFSTGLDALYFHFPFIQLIHEQNFILALCVFQIYSHSASRRWRERRRERWEVKHTYANTPARTHRWEANDLWFHQTRSTRTSWGERWVETHQACCNRGWESSSRH